MPWPFTERIDFPLRRTDVLLWFAAAVAIAVADIADWERAALNELVLCERPAAESDEEAGGPRPGGRDRVAAERVPRPLRARTGAAAQPPALRRVRDAATRLHRRRLQRLRHLPQGGQVRPSSSSSPFPFDLFFFFVFPLWLARPLSNVIPCPTVSCKGSSAV